MNKINLKDYYDHINTDTFIDIPDEVFNIFEEHRKAEQACQSRIRCHKACYALHRGDGIEHNPLFVSLSPHEIYERKLTTEQLHAAIAKAEGVNKSQVTRSISRYLSHPEKYLKNIF